MDSRLIQMLNQALEAEYQATHQYLHHYNNVRSKFNDVVGHFEEHMADEQKHARSLAERIFSLGGTPSTGMAKLAQYTDNIDEAIKQDILAEKEAIKLYKEIIAYCAEIDDVATSMLVEDILLDEVHHLDEFSRFVRIAGAK